MAERSIPRTGDGVPKYDGTPELLPLYKEEAVQYLMTFEHKKRYLAGPRLIKELEGTAKVAVRTKTLRDPQWVSHPRGVYALREHLEASVGRPSLPEASRHVMKFFYNLQRRKGETMTSWITRHADALWEASQALRKVQKEHGSQDSKGKGESRWSAHSNPPMSFGSREDDEKSPFDDNGLLREDEGSEVRQGYHGDPWRWWHAWEEWSGDGWSQHSWRTPEYDPPEDWDRSNDIFIPEFLAGFLLLHRAGLDSQERGNVLAAIRGQFSTETVGRALREQWSDEDIQKRDRLKGNSALVAEGFQDELEALMADDDDLGPGDLDTESLEAYMAEQTKIDEAMAAIQTQKTTLKEARWKQKQLKLGRGFFPPKPFQRPSQDSRNSQGKRCFRCNGPHLMADCPQKNQQAKVVQEESAEIAFVTGEVQVEEAGFLGEECYEAMGTEKALEQCMGIIDSGATSSLGSAEALERIMEENLQHHGETKMDIDVSRRPTFRFGNGQRKDCLSTVRVGIGAGTKAGSMEIHVHDTPGQPVLVSRKALKGLGAAIDFEAGLAIYKNVDKNQVVRLTEADNGHLPMPITGNILTGAMSRQTPFVSLFDE